MSLCITREQISKWKSFRLITWYSIIMLKLWTKIQYSSIPKLWFYNVMILQFTQTKTQLLWYMLQNFNLIYKHNNMYLFRIVTSLFCLILHLINYHLLVSSCSGTHCSTLNTFTPKNLKSNKITKLKTLHLSPRVLLKPWEVCSKWLTAKYQHIFRYMLVNNLCGCRSIRKFGEISVFYAVLHPTRCHFQVSLFSTLS